MTGEVRFESGTNPQTPSTGKVTLYADAATGNLTQINAAGQKRDLAANVTLPSNVQPVNSVIDLPPAIAGQRFLQNNTTYILGADITIDEEIIFPATAVFQGTHANGATLTTTASRLFVGENSTGWVKDINLDAPNGTVFDFSDPSLANQSVLNIRDVNIKNCTKMAILDSLLGAVLDNISVNANDGVEFIGAGWFVQSITNMGMFLQAAGIGIDFGTSVAEIISIEGPIINGPAGAVAINGAPNSANLIPNAVGTVVNCGLNAGGLITPLTGITTGDIRWMFRDNAGVPDSAKAADTFLTLSRTVPIVEAGVYVPINGTDWSSEVNERFNVTNTGLLTYTNERTGKILVTASASVTKVGGGADRIAMRIAINGVTQPKTFCVSQNAAPTTVTSIGLFDLQKDDTVQLYVANLDGISDVIVSSAILTAVGVA